MQFYVMLLLLSMTISCKKDTVNNPDINDVALNVSVENTDPANFSNLNVTLINDASLSFQFFIFNPDGDQNNHTIELRIYNADYEFLIQRPDDTYTIKKVEKTTEINPSNEIWHINDGRFILMYYEKDGTKYGFSDIGDQYIAFRKKNTTGGYNYGWILINIERGEKITIKEYALHNVADTPIKAGEK